MCLYLLYKVKKTNTLSQNLRHLEILQNHNAHNVSILATVS